VQPVDGEDYGSVPTTRAEPQWVLQALPSDSPERRALILHAAGCWAASGRLAAADSVQAAIFLREKWATACEACKPEPGRPTVDGSS
jgi:hypothetical protein